MAPINKINNESQEYIELLDSWTATICLMAGMVISLLGIKIWWFKHRLNFQQTPAQNGDSRGSQSILGNTSKDKRQSQQVSDSVFVHGIFRKRNEDELEAFEQPKQLPPIRVPVRSMSATALIPPPRTRIGDLTPEIPISMRQPPTRPAPIPIPDQKTFVESNKPDIAIDDSLSEAERPFQKVNPTLERKNFENPSIERRATGFLNTSDTQDLETFIESVPKSANETQTIPKITELPHESIENIDSLQGQELLQEQPKNRTVELFYKDLENIENDSDGSIYHRSSINNDGYRSQPIYNEKPFYATQSNHVPQMTTKMDKSEDLDHIPLEIENVEKFDNEFHYYINKEFEKRRQSYQEHEGHFLELNEEALKKEDHALSPIGFGKSIDEDWENFQDLKTTTYNEFQEVKITTTEAELQTHFELDELETVTEDHCSYTVHSNTSYVQSIEELYDELSDTDVEDNSASNIVITHSVSPPQKSSILKERLQVFANANYEAPSGKAHKLRAQQKVTFDTHTEEYYLPESDDSSDSMEEHKNGNNDGYEDDFDNDESDFDIEPPNALPPPLPKSTMPTPMQRTTKIQYGEMEQNWGDQQQQHATALLFSTQISMDNTESNNVFDTNNDSWSAIRQRRFQNNSDAEINITPMPRESPTPAHRGVPLNEQREIQPVPRLRRNSTEA